MDQESWLLPADASGILSGALDPQLSQEEPTNWWNPSLFSTSSVSSNSTHHQHHQVFNFSLREALEILREHERSSDRLLVPDTQIAIIVIYSLLMTTGVVSNALVCFVVSRQCSRKSSQVATGPTPRNMYIVNLAVADLALCLVCMPFTLVSLLKRRWTLGLLLCKLVPVLQGANIMVSVGTITAIALDRYYTIVRSPRGPAAFCRRVRCSVATTICLIWTVSFLSMAPLLVYQEVEVVRLGGLVVYEACVERWPSRQAQAAYTLALSLAQFALPVLVLSTIHARISSYLSVHLSSPPVDSTCKRARREWRRNRRTMMILTCIAVVFALSWLPMTSFTLVVEFKPGLVTSASTLYTVFAACHIAAMSTAVTNPLLYGWLNTNFRREFRSLGGGGSARSGGREGARVRAQGGGSGRGGGSAPPGGGEASGRAPSYYRPRHDSRRISVTCFTTVTSSSNTRPSTTLTLLPHPSTVDVV